MLRRRGLILLVVSLVLGLGAAMAARGWVAEQSARNKTETASVIAAAMAIPFGTKIEERHLKVIEMPPSSVPQHWPRRSHRWPQARAQHLLHHGACSLRPSRYSPNHQLGNLR